MNPSSECAGQTATSGHCGVRKPIMFYRQRSKVEKIHLVGLILWRLKKKDTDYFLLFVVEGSAMSDICYEAHKSFKVFVSVTAVDLMLNLVASL